MASKYQYPKAKIPHMLVLTLAMMLLSHAMGDDSALEKRKCVEQLTDMTTCLPYVGGDAKVPTSDCCNGLIQSIIKNNKRCICLLIKDRDDPDLGLNIKLNLALALPSLCKAPDFSQCPALLHLDPKSAEAQAFNQVVQNSTGGSISPSPNYSANGRSSQNGKGTNETADAKNYACYKRKRMLISSVAWLLLWFCGA